MITASPPAGASAEAGPFRVMVVDDSAIIRGFLSRYLSEDPDIDVITTAYNGVAALRELERNDVEVAVLDIEMPEMDGLTALPKMIDLKPDLMVVMASTLTRKNADVSLRSLQMGAVDYVPKPETARNVNASIDFRRELVDKVKAWAGRRRKKRGEALPESAGPDALGTGSASTAKVSPGFVRVERPARPTARVTTSTHRSDAATAGSAFQPASVSRVAASDTKPAVDGSSYNLQPETLTKPHILAIGSSTGGPQALMKFFATFDKAPQVPIIITQHMPPTFTAILAQHLGQATGWEAEEASEGMALKAGKIFVAPGGKHMLVDRRDGGDVLKLDDGPPENFCKPAVDPMLRSVAKRYGKNALCVILTGMGHDGLKGARELVGVGGTVIAQDEASSVVWGMPGAVATAGLCTEISPLEDLGKSTYRRLAGGF